MNMLYFAHSGLRYLVLVVALVALAYYAYALFATRPHGRAAHAVGAAFTGLLDLQVLLGLLLLFVFPWYGALIGHLVMMLLALVVAHAAAVLARRQASDGAKYRLRLAGVAAALVLVLGGILAIGRTPFESRAPGVVAVER